MSFPSLLGTAGAGLWYFATHGEGLPSYTRIKPFDINDYEWADKDLGEPGHAELDGGCSLYDNLDNDRRILTPQLEMELRARRRTVEMIVQHFEDMRNREIQAAREKIYWKRGSRVLHMTRRWKRRRRSRGWKLIR